MNSVHVRWNDINFDLRLDQYPSLVVEERGNKGVGTIVFICCTIAVFLPSSFTLIKILNGTATGHPIGAIIAVFLILGWPIYWSVNQYFLWRSFILRDKKILFTFARLFQKKKVTVKIEEYIQIEYGKTRSQSSEGQGVGSIGRYSRIFNLPVVGVTLLKLQKKIRNLLK